MFSCSEETFEETDEETYTNVAIQTDPSYPQSMTTNTSSNIKPITNPNPKVPVSGSDKYKSPNNETKKKQSAETCRQRAKAFSPSV